MFFGGGDILVNNIAWMLRRFPVFGCFGDGTYRVRPIHVDDFARLAVSVGAEETDLRVDAVGPETWSYRELVRMLGAAIGQAPPDPDPAAVGGARRRRCVGRVLGDILLTGDEIDALMDDLLATDGPAARNDAAEHVGGGPRRDAGHALRATSWRAGRAGTGGGRRCGLPSGDSLCCPPRARCGPDQEASMRKIGILGGGNVGATAAFVAASLDLGEVALYDICEGVPAGKALDMTQAAPVLRLRRPRRPARTIRRSSPASEVVIVTAGFPRKPGMDRMDLLKKNVEIAQAAGDDPQDARARRGRRSPSRTRSTS